MLAGIALILAIIIMLFVIAAFVGFAEGQKIVEEIEMKVAEPPCGRCGARGADNPYFDSLYCDRCFLSALDEEEEQERERERENRKREKAHRRALLRAENRERKAAEQLEETREKWRRETLWTGRNDDGREK